VRQCVRSAPTSSNGRRSITSLNQCFARSSGTAGSLAAVDTTTSKIFPRVYQNVARTFFHSTTLLQVNKEMELEDLPSPLVKVAVLGPPNAGKSTLFNRLLDKSINKSYMLSSEKKMMKRGRRKGGRGGRFSATKVKRKYTAGTAIVSDIAGTTRDRREGIGRIGGTYFQLVDTAGVDGERLDHFFDFDSDKTRKKALAQTHKQKFSPGKHKKHEVSKSTMMDANETTAQSHITNPKDILRPMMQQALQAAREANLIVLMFDARVGLTADFYETCRWLRKYASPQKKKKKPEPQDDDDASLLGAGTEIDSAIATDTEEDGNETSPQKKKKKKKKKKKISRQPDQIQRVILLANKLEGQLDQYSDTVQDHLIEATRTGLGDVVPVSALHGEGVTDLCVAIDELQRELTKKHEEFERKEMEGKEGGYELQPKVVEKKEKPLQLAILGRINVGKSTLVNSLLKQERVITGPTPGLTRDAISIPWSYKGRPVQIVDTAGLRKKPSQRTDQDIEDMAVLDAMRAMKTADVAVMVLDARALHLQRHELGIARAVLDEGRALVVVANKMDLLGIDWDYTPQDFEDQVRGQLEEGFPLLRQTPIIAVSSLTGQCVDSILPVVFQARDRWQRQISTGLLNRWLSEVLIDQSPPMTNGRPTRIKYMIQTKGRPPTFLLFCNVNTLPESYLNFLTRQFQESFEFYGMPVRLVVKQSAPENPFNTVKRKKFVIGGRESRWQKRLFKWRNPKLAAKDEKHRRLKRSRRGRSKKKWG